MQGEHAGGMFGNKRMEFRDDYPIDSIYCVPAGAIGTSKTSLPRRVSLIGIMVSLKLFTRLYDAV